MTPTTYEAKPVRVEAMQHTGTMESFDAFWEWLDGDDLKSPMLGYEGMEDKFPIVFGVRTPTGSTRVSVGDWLIRSASGQFSRLKPDEFDAAYREIAPEPQ